jgi:hypothetical protein
MTHKPGSEYDVLQWYKESIVDKFKNVSDSESAERAKTIAGIALSWAVGFGYLTGKIVETGAKKSLSASRRVIDDVVDAGATIFADSKEQTGENIKTSNSSVLTAFGVVIEGADRPEQVAESQDRSTRIARYPFFRLPNIASLSSSHFEEVYAPEPDEQSDLLGVE